MTEEQKTEIYKQYYDKVMGYFIGKVGDPTWAEDLCSDVFVKVYEKIDSFDETKASFSTWIYTIARNTLWDSFRTRKINTEIDETFADGNSSVEDEVINSESLERLADALEELGEKERDVIVLHYYDCMSFTDISKKTGMSYSYVRVLHEQALKKMKKYF